MDVINSKDFKWYAIKVDVIRISTIKNNIKKINTKYIKRVYDINDILKHHKIRKGILFIYAYMCEAIKRIILRLEHTYGFIPSNMPCPIHDFGEFIKSMDIKEKEKITNIHSINTEVDNTIITEVSHKEEIENIHIYKPGLKIIITFGIFKDCIGYIQSVNYETKNMTVKVILNDSDLEMITDISMFYAKII